MISNTYIIPKIYFEDAFYNSEEELLQRNTDIFYDLSSYYVTLQKVDSESSEEYSSSRDYVSSYFSRNNQEVIVRSNITSINELRNLLFEEQQLFIFQLFSMSIVTLICILIIITSIINTGMYEGAVMYLLGLRRKNLICIHYLSFFGVQLFSMGISFLYLKLNSSIEINDIVFILSNVVLSVAIFVSTFIIYIKKCTPSSIINLIK